MSAPPFEVGAVQVAVIAPFELLYSAVGVPGVPGTVGTVTVGNARPVEDPMRLLAYNVNVYCAPAVRPDTV